MFKNKLSPRERVFSKIRRTPACWIWNANKGDKGYGRLKVKGKYQSAHRFSYEAFTGPIPEKMFVCHTCDIPLCVNPEHLLIGNHKDNAQDCAKKGRCNHAGEHN